MKRRSPVVVRRLAAGAATTSLAVGTALVGPATTAPARAAAQPVIAVVSDVSVPEGNAFARAHYLRVERTGDLSRSSSVKVTLTDTTATPGTDFTIARTVTTIAFPAGRAAATVVVRVVGDHDAEPDETLTFTLSDVVGATLGDDTGVVTIVNDDPSGTPSFSVADATITEGDSGTALLAFTVSRSGSLAEAVSVMAGPVAGTATAPRDFNAKAPAVVSFAVGQSTRLVKVAVRGDLVAEPEETFTVELSDPAGGTIADGSGVGTILDND